MGQSEWDQVRQESLSIENDDYFLVLFSCFTSLDPLSSVFSSNLVHDDGRIDRLHPLDSLDDLRIFPFPLSPTSSCPPFIDHDVVEITTSSSITPIRRTTYRTFLSNDLFRLESVREPLGGKNRPSPRTGNHDSSLREVGRQVHESRQGEEGYDEEGVERLEDGQEGWEVRTRVQSGQGREREEVGRIDVSAPRRAVQVKKLVGPDVIREREGKSQTREFQNGARGESCDSTRRASASRAIVEARKVRQQSQYCSKSRGE